MGEANCLMTNTRCVSKDGIQSQCYTYTDFLLLKSSEKNYKASINFLKIKEFEKVVDIKKILHYDECKYFETLKHSRRKNSFLLGRYSAKKAISVLTGEEEPEKILIKNGIFNQPIVIYDSFSNLQISLTHCDDIAASVAFTDLIVLGIDIERINKRISLRIEDEITKSEKELANSVSHSYESFLMIIWTIKESISKILKTGLTIPLSILEVKDLEAQDGYYVSTFVNFNQYKSISFIIEEYVCSITLPKNVEIYIDISGIKNSLYKIIRAKSTGIFPNIR